MLMSSVLADRPVPALFGTHAYAAAKGANDHPRDLDGCDVARRTDTRIDVLAPGLTATPMAQRAATDRTTVKLARRKQPLANGFLDSGGIAASGRVLPFDGVAHRDGPVPGDRWWLVRHGGLMALVATVLGHRRRWLRMTASEHRHRQRPGSGLYPDFDLSDVATMATEVRAAAALGLRTAVDADVLRHRPQHPARPS